MKVCFVISLIGCLLLPNDGAADIRNPGIVDRFENDLTSKWSTIAEGDGDAGIANGEGVDGTSALRLIMPEGEGKRAVVVLKHVPQPTEGQPIRLVFDMRLDTTPGGYRKGIRYGRPGYAVEFGRYGRRNFDKLAGHIFLGDQHATIDLPLDSWIRYQVTITPSRQTLRAFAITADDRLSSQPIAQLTLETQLSTLTNDLIVFNESPFHADRFKQQRGSLWLENFRLHGGMLENTADLTDDVVEIFADGTCRFAVNKQHGNIASGYFQGKRVLDTSVDEYRLTLRDHDILTSEWGDRVVETRGESSSGVTFVCSNPKLPGLTIEKDYKIVDGQLAKVVRFTSSQDIDGFLLLRTAGSPADQLKDGGYYHTIKGWEVNTLRSTDSVLMEQKIGHPHADTGNQIVSLVNPEKGLTIGQFQYRIDGQYVWPRHYIHNDSTTYAPAGWRFPSMVFHPRASETYEVETRMVVLPGDQLNFHRLYRQMGEVAQRLNVQSSDWVRKAKFDAVCWGDEPLHFSRLAQGALDVSRYTDDEYAFVNMWGWATWGHHPTEPNETVRVRSENTVKSHMPTQWLVDQVSQIHRELPGIKFGLYHFPWAFAPQSDFGKANLNQMAYDRDGELLPKPEPGWTAAYRALLADGGVEQMLTHFQREMDRYDVDFFYLDGGVWSQSRPDWRTMTADQGYDWMRIWEGVFNIARNTSSDKAVYQNHFVQMFGDAGYYEDGVFARTYAENWRVIGDGLQMAKNYQRPGGYLSVLYRAGGGKAEPAYTNMVLATGLRPAAAADPHVVPNWSEWFAYLPYVNAAYELRDTVLVDAVRSPRWWADVEKAGTLQAITLQQGSALMVNLVNHADRSRQYEVTVDLDAAEMGSNRPLYIWRQDVEPSDYLSVKQVYSPAEPAALRQVVTVSPYKHIRPVEPILTQNFELNKHALTSFVITDQPSVITAVGYRNTQFWLPDILDAHVRTEPDGGRLEVTVDSPQAPVSIAIWLPEEWKGGAVVVEPSSILAHLEVIGDASIAHLSLPEGKHILQLRPKDK